jgi:nucleotide-binding universal stress UspA family protein
LQVVGFVGRKEDILVIGTAADYSLRSAHMSAVIVKRRTVLPSEVFVVGVDGSDRAHRGVELALQLRRPEDTVIVLHVENPALECEETGKYHASAVAARYSTFCADKANCSFSSTQVHGAVAVADVIVDWAADHDATFIVIGADGVGAYAVGHEARLGSVSDAVVKKARCNIICIQERHATYIEHEGSASARR